MALENGQISKFKILENLKKIKDFVKKMVKLDRIKIENQSSVNRNYAVLYY